MVTRGDCRNGQCPDVVHVKEEPEHPPPLNCGMKPPGDSRQGQEVGLVKEEPLEHSPQLGGVRTLNAPKLKQLTTPTKKRRGRPLKPDDSDTPTKKTRGRPLKPDDSDISSPSILVSGLPEIKNPAKEIQKLVPKSPAVPKTDKNSDSRRASITRAVKASDFFWANDISGSSITTCYTVKSVNCNDFLRIELKKLKLKKLTVDQIEKKTEEVNEKIVEKDELDNSSDGSSSSNSSSETENTAFENRLNEVTSNLAMLRSRINLGFPGIEKKENSDMSQFVGIVSKYLEAEYNAMLECSKLNLILSESYVPKVAPEIEQKHSFTKPGLTGIPKSISDNRNTRPCNMDRRRDSYDPPDDDDALLLAESLTGNPPG